MATKNKSSWIKRDKELDDLIKGRSLGLVREPRCKICKSQLLNRVNRLAAAGFGGTSIADEIMGQDPTLSTNRDALRKCIERHINLHLKIKDAAIRQVLENRAREAGVVLEEYKGQFINDGAFLDLMVRQGLEQITDPNARIHYKDALEAVRIKKDIEQANFAAQLETMERQVYAISQAIKDVVPEEYYEQVVERARLLFDEPVLDLPKKVDIEMSALELEEDNE